MAAAEVAVPGRVPQPALLTELRDGTRQPKPLLSTRFAPLRVSLTRQNPRGVCRNARPSPAPLPARRCLHAATPRGPNTGRPPAPSAQPCPGTARRRGDRPLTQRSHRPARPTGAARSAASCPRPSAGTAWSPCCHVPRLCPLCAPGSGAQWQPCALPAPRGPYLSQQCVSAWKGNGELPWAVSRLATARPLSLLLAGRSP